MQRKAALALMLRHDSRHGPLAQQALHHPSFGYQCALWVKCSMASPHAVSTSSSMPHLLQVESIPQEQYMGTVHDAWERVKHPSQ